MGTSTNWLDRLRSRLTGQPAKVYATRRIAKADIHALEEQRAHAVARLNEDIELIDRYVNPLERYMDGDRLLTPLGTILDRRSGKNLPLVWTELDLREFRRWARVICDVNPFAVGFLGLLTDFHIRQGFGWQVVRRQGSGDRSQEYNSNSSRSPELALIQEVLDDWRDSQQWGLRSREAFRRWRRDGEVFLRFFRGGRETRGLPVIRFVEPEQIGPPPGDDADGRWSFGILTDPEDVEDVQVYFVRDPLGTGSEGDEVPAHRILHLKANVDSSIKRGLPDFLPVQDDLERVRRMLRNMGEVAAIQTAIAWVSQYATATVDQVGTLIRAGSDYTRPKLGDPSGKLMDVVNYEPGTVIHMDSNRQFLAGPVGTGTAGFIQVEQAILRGSGARWRFPEYFSGDASNNNMASSIVAGSPFVVAVEGNQLEWGVFERAVAKKVLELCVESGRLSREQVASVDVKVAPPAVALANREEEERLREMRNKAGVLSVTTWQQQVGLDPKHEAANFEAEAKKKGAEGSGEKTVGESEDNCECEEEISEGMLKGKKFTGEIRDSLGRRRCYHKGKQIPCDKLAQMIASSGELGQGEPQAKKPPTAEPDPASRNEQDEEKRFMENRRVKVDLALHGLKLLKQDPTLFENKQYQDSKLEGILNGNTVTFKFDKAYSGSMDLFGEKEYEKGYGVYVKIAADVVPAVGKKFDEIRIIQIVRNYKKDENGKPVPIDPVNTWRREQSHWENPGALSPGWWVDYSGNTNLVEPELYYANGSFGVHQKQRSVIFDAPANAEKGAIPAKNAGKEFYTAAIGWYQDKRKNPEYLGAVHWGFYVNDKHEVSFEPHKPEFLAKPPEELGNSIAKVHSYLLYASRTDKLDALLTKIPEWEGKVVIKAIDGVKIPDPPKFVSAPEKK